VDNREILRRLTAAVDSGRSVVLVTVVSTSRSVPRHAGSKMLVHPDRTTAGSVGGGEMEARVVDAAIEALARGRAVDLTYDLVDPSVGDPGVCGGSVHLFLEPYMPPDNIVVIGCGHVGAAVIELAHWMGRRVTAIDDRAELADPARLPAADLVLAGPVSEMLSAAPVDESTDIVIVTRNVQVDLELLPVAIGTPARSIGIMGSRRRWATTKERLLERGIDADQLAAVRSPIGIQVGAETPNEIALSILAELVELHSRQRDRASAPDVT
jgi:xanthine dehydrogenase accessory factor